jgi:RND family efflux transporter MFP subunit
MRSLAGWIIPIAFALAGVVGGYWFGAHHHSEEAATTQPAEEEHAVISVVTAPLKATSIAETVTAYGTVVAEAGDVRAISVPFESRVARVLVTPGQPLAQGTPIIQSQASPDAQIALQEAKNALEVATRDLKQTEQRFADHLTTNIELSQAQQALQTTKLKLDSLTQRGVGVDQTLKADVAGIVSKVDVQEGQIVPAGGPLVELAAGNRIEVRLNVEPSDAQTLKPDADVQILPVDHSADAKPIAGKVRIIGQRVDPGTRLVEVRVTLPPETRLMLDSFVTGQLTRAAASGWVVPRDAALPNEEGGYSLYTVKDGKAVQHAVRLGLQQDNLVQVLGDDLKEGDAVVVRGNYLLSDGAPVEVEAAATQPASAPAEAKAEAKQ